MTTEKLDRASVNYSFLPKCYFSYFSIYDFEVCSGKMSLCLSNNKDSNYYIIINVCNNHYYNKEILKECTLEKLTDQDIFYLRIIGKL